MPGPALAPNRIAPVVLCILDGFGVAPDAPGNAVTRAAMPNWTRLQAEGLRATLAASGPAVGLPEGQMGNSEVGHLNMGAGRIVPQDIVRIDRDIATGAFRANPVLRGVARRARDDRHVLHLIGLVGPGGVHSHERHLFALLDLARHVGEVDVAVHAILDGRDTPPRSAGAYLARLVAKTKEAGSARVATVMGRYWGMDRDTRWDRTMRAYRALVAGEGEVAPDAPSALEAAYARGETDEFVVPTVVRDTQRVRRGDGVVFVNFRPDRARQLTRALAEPAFDAFPVEPLGLDLAIMTRYQAGFESFAKIAYPPVRPEGTLGEAVAAAGLRQLRIAETEKYAHVTYFVNGGREEPFPGEERILVPSPRIATYDLMPEMSAPEVTRRLLAVLEDAPPPHLVVLNYANPDMVGHTGDLEATKRALAAIDDALGALAAATIRAGGVLLVTADHGNAEEMLDPAGGPVTKHTTNPVPFLLHAAHGALPAGAALRPEGLLSDVAPTVLDLLGVPRPAPMDRPGLLLQE